MANNLQSSINWARAFVNYMKLTIGQNNEPAMSAANMTKQTFLGPPFKFPWNRSKASFVFVPMQQDYTLAITDFGFLEIATFQPCAQVTQVSSTGGTATYIGANNFTVGAKVSVSGLTTAAFNVQNQAISAATASQFQIALAGTVAATADKGLALSGKAEQFGRANNVTAVGESTDVQKPIVLTVHINDNQGNITFRNMGTPNGYYNVVVTYQKAATPLLLLADPWGMPDSVSYVYNKGFLAHMFEAMGDPRAQAEKIGFAAALLALSEGLTETEVNVFLAQYLGNIVQLQAAQIKTTQGAQGRGQ